MTQAQFEPKDPGYAQRVRDSCALQGAMGTIGAALGDIAPGEVEILLDWAKRDFARGFDPAGLTRQQTVSLVGHFESASYRLNNLEKITAPTVVLQGEDDPLVPVASAEDIAARVPGAELRLIPGLGHDIPAELVTTFADAITAAAKRASD